MARFWKEKKKKKGRKRQGERTDAIVQGFYEDLTTPGLFKGEGKVKGSEASLVNSGAIAEYATPQSSAWGDRAFCPQLHTTYCAI